jgi:alpha-glucosidase
MLLLTLRGTPTLYYGDELGMHDVAIPPERVCDPQALNQPGVGRTRDTARTPMQWTGGHAAGFTSGEPWLPVSVDHARVNVEAQRDDPYSFLALHRRLLELRRSEPALSVGSFAPVPGPANVMAYVREAAGRRFLVALNLSHAPAILELEHGALEGEVVCATYVGRHGERVARRILLEGDEGLVVRLDPVP